MAQGRRKSDGAVLALVVALGFVLLIVGAAFFFWQLLIGGGKELQHATDSGNLNVAKQSLKNPDYTVPSGIDPTTGTDLSLEFQDVLDPGNKVNLLNYNRLVGKAVLAQLNAQAEGTNAAAKNAAQLTQAVLKIGQILENKLAASGSLKTQFEGMSNQNSVRMLDNGQGGAGNSVSQNDVDYAIAYMARGKASNVFFDLNSIPAGASLGPSDTVTKDVNGNKQFLSGYQSFSFSSKVNGVPQTWAVPMRPGEQPHLVSIKDFNSLEKPPFQPFTLANAFMSGGQANFSKAGGNVQLRSCAVVGVLDKTFPIQQSGGTIIIDNYGNSFNGDLNDPGNSIYAGPLMQPAGIEIFRVTAYGSFPTSGKTRDFMAYYEGKGPLPSDVIKSHSASTQDGSISASEPENSCKTYPDNGAIDGTDLWAMKMNNQGRYVSRYPERCTIMGTTGQGPPGQSVGGGTATTITHVATCNSGSFGGGGPSQCTDPNAGDIFASFLNGDVGVKGGATGSTHYNDLMPLEQYILEVEGGFGGGSGCVTVPAMGTRGYCITNGNSSGLKHLAGRPPFPTGTLDDLLADCNAQGSIKADLAARMRQIAPGADPNTIFSKPIPFNSVLYITNKNGQLDLSDSVPSSLQYDYKSQANNRDVNRPLTINGVPDGEKDYKNNEIAISGRWVNSSFWECGSGRMSGKSDSVANWYPSSGKAGLLGVLRFKNCPEADGPDWCCP